MCMACTNCFTDVDTQITIHLHNVFAHCNIDYDATAARENFEHLDKLIPTSQCSSYFEVSISHRM